MMFSKHKRILIISYEYPPANSIGSLRISKFTKYLYQWGWEPYVITVPGQKSLLNDLPYEIPEEFIYTTKMLDFNRFISYIYRVKQIDKSNTSGLRMGFIRRFLEYIKDAGRKVIIPDGKVGWYPYVIKKGREIIPKIKPILIFASGGPYTGLMAAARLSKDFNLPWVADIRDLWADNYLIKKFSPFSAINEFIEKKTLSSASRIITVSEPLADILSNRYGRSKIAIVYNGYDEEDFVNNAGSKNDNTFVIRYVGRLYKQQNPEPLFESIKKLLNGQPIVNLKVNFYGPLYPYWFFDLIDKYNLRGVVSYYGQIPHKESINVQINSDLLLLLLWNDTKHKGIIAGKLSEYIGANRPILAVGLETDSAGELVKEYNLGFVSNDSDKIKGYLEDRLTEKRKFGETASPSINPSIKQFFTRKKQAEILAGVLEEVIFNKNIKDGL